MMNRTTSIRTGQSYWPPAPEICSLLPERFLEDYSRASARRADGAGLIYIVDDEPEWTELSSVFLKATGYRVRAFNHRAEALTALTVDVQRPVLLITDYLGHAMPVGEFMRRCLTIHPSLRILMASGLSQSEARFPCVRPHHFIQKPFTPKGFLSEVEAALLP
jgi:response regulator RpfG family c-di-GMP phosphodiesterase